MKSHSSEYLKSGNSDAWNEWTRSLTLPNARKYRKLYRKTISTVTKKRSQRSDLVAYCCCCVAATSTECRCPKSPRVHVEPTRKGKVKPGREVIRSLLACTGRSITEGMRKKIELVERCQCSGCAVPRLTLLPL